MQAIVVEVNHASRIGGVRSFGTSQVVHNVSRLSFRCHDSLDHFTFSFLKALLVYICKFAMFQIIIDKHKSIMSFLGKIFGGGPKKPAVDPVQQQKIQQEKAQFQTDKAKETIEEQMKKMEEKVEKANQEIAVLETQVKQHLMEKKKDKAAVVLKKLKAKKENAAKLTKMSMALQQQLINLESTTDDSDFIEAIKAGNKVQEANRDKYEQQAEEIQKMKELQEEHKMRQGEIDDILNMDDDQDDLDEMMKEYEQQAADEMVMNFEKTDKMIQKNPAQTNPAQTQPAKAQKKDDFDSMFAGLMS